MPKAIKKYFQLKNCFTVIVVGVRKKCLACYVHLFLQKKKKNQAFLLGQKIDSFLSSNYKLIFYPCMVIDYI